MEQSNQEKRIRLSTIYTRYFDDYLLDPKHPVSKETFKAVNQTIACRTTRIGVNIYECPDCGERKYVLRSCKNRFCPRCGYVDTKKWAAKMLEKIADCGHHHIVFTLPASLRIIGLQNKDKFHSLLLRSAAETMLDWFKAKYQLEPGIMNVLHSAGSDQKYHPHVHMICSAGGMDTNDHFKKLPDNWYLINQKFLSRKFRWHFEGGLIGLVEKKEIKVPYENMISFKQFIKQINSQDWVVSVQRPLKKADDIVGYVGRYTKRACISEYNILSADNGEICFRYKDYKHTDHQGRPEKAELTLGYRDFFGRLFEHVPSKGFRMVRYYGMYSSRKIKRINPKKVIDNERQKKDGWRDYQIQRTGVDPLMCPCCGCEMKFLEEYYDKRTRWQRIQRKDKIPDYWPKAV